MFTISNIVIATLQGFFEAFAKDGIAKVPNEDVRAATEQIIAVAERLTEVSVLPSESTRHILEGFTRCSVIIFRQTFAHLLVAERLQQLRYLTNRNDSSCLIDIKTEWSNWCGLPTSPKNIRLSSLADDKDMTPLDHLSPASAMLDQIRFAK